VTAAIRWTGEDGAEYEITCQCRDEEHCTCDLPSLELPEYRSRCPHGLVLWGGTNEGGTNEPCEACQRDEREEPQSLHDVGMSELDFLSPEDVRTR
jgi:hypothetical protein